MEKIILQIQAAMNWHRKKNALMDNRLFISKTDDISNTATVPFNTDW